MSSQILAAVNWINAVKAQLNDARIALEKVADELTRIEAGLRAEMTVDKESYETEETRVESRKRELATEVDKKHQLLTARRETS